MNDKLTIEEAEYFANKMDEKMDYVFHEVRNPDGSSTSCDMESVLRQLLDTMRENEQLKARLKAYDDENEAKGNLLRNSGLEVKYSPSDQWSGGGGGGE